MNKQFLGRMGDVSLAGQIDGQSFQKFCLLCFVRLVDTEHIRMAGVVHVFRIFFQNQKVHGAVGEKEGAGSLGLLQAGQGILGLAVEKRKKVNIPKHQAAPMFTFSEAQALVRISTRFRWVSDSSLAITTREVWIILTLV